MLNLVFVDENDNVIGAGTRQEAMEKGYACRIARIFVFNSRGELLLQKRSSLVAAPNKWDDSAAGHVDEGEEYLEAAYRELEEELGIKGVVLAAVDKYYTETPNDTEQKIVGKRFHTLYKAIYDGEVTPNPREIADVKWLPLPDIKQWIAERPDDFAGGFLIALQKYLAKHGE